MAAVFAGYFAFSWAGKHEGIDFFRNHAVWCAIAGAFCSAISSLWDKYLFQVRDLPVEDAWNPVESLALAPMGRFWLDAAMGLAPDLPEVPEEYYEAAQ